MRHSRIVALVVAALSAGLSAQTPVLPAGFLDEPVASGLQGPMDLDFLPDGRLVFIEQTGRVGAVVQGAIVTLGTVPDLSISYSRGLIAVAVDPLWPHRPYLYVWHTHAPTASMRLTRYAVTGDLSDAASGNLALGSAHLVLDGVPDVSPQHNGGFLEFGTDRGLYLSTGDDMQGCDAQDLSSLSGKILRLDVSALPVGAGGPPPRSAIAAAGNPFMGGDVAPLVWALGVRNPFRGHADPIEARVFVADVGDVLFDEIDVIAAPGANLGWPFYEAFQPLSVCATTPPTQLAPVVAHAVGTSFTALISLGVYRNRAAGEFDFGAEYEGSYFYVDHFVGDVVRLVEQAGGYTIASVVTGQPSPGHWATGIRYAVAAAVGPDGALYWIERQARTTGAIRRIRPAAAGAHYGFLGKGCASSSGVATLSAQGVPRIGQAFVVDVGTLPAPRIAAMALGFDRLSWAGGDLPADLTPIGMDDCLLRIDPFHTEVLPEQNGVATWTLAIPNVASLLTLQFFHQAIVLDAAAPNALGVLLSDAGGGVMGI